MPDGKMAEVTGATYNSTTLDFDYINVQIRNDASYELPLTPSEITIAQGAFTSASSISIPVSTSYWIELWADPNAAGGSISDVIWGIYQINAVATQPTSDTDGVPIATGMRHRVHQGTVNAIMYLTFRKHSQTDFPCRFRAIRYASLL